MSNKNLFFHFNVNAVSCILGQLYHISYFSITSLLRYLPHVDSSSSSPSRCCSRCQCHRATRVARPGKPHGGPDRWVSNAAARHVCSNRDGFFFLVTALLRVALEMINTKPAIDARDCRIVDTCLREKNLQKYTTEPRRIESFSPEWVVWYEGCCWQSILGYSFMVLKCCQTFLFLILSSLID